MTPREAEAETLPAVKIDHARVEAFGGKMMRALNDASMVLMISIGHRTGLFDTMAGRSPSTDTELATAARLEERYVREWLGAMVTSRVVEYDPATRRYALPPEHAASLTRAAAPDNLAAFAQYIPLLGTVEEHVITAFRRGGGVPYEAFTRFDEVMAEDSGQTVLPALIDSILPLVPRIVERLAEGIDVLDVGCGAGRALNLLAAAFPKSRFTGYDLSPGAVRRARAEARRGELTNVRFEVRDVADLYERDAFDLITAFDAIHDQAEPARVLASIRRALSEDGVFLMQDIDTSSELHENLEHPIGTFLYTISTMHCMTVSLACGGKGLGTCWGRQTASRMLGEAGFPDVRIHTLPHDIQNCYYIARPTSDSVTNAP